jgi:hypothetical protein
MDDLKELFSTYSKATDSDSDIHEACEELVRMFDEAAGDRNVFIARLKEAARYASWEPRQ